MSSRRLFVVVSGGAASGKTSLGLRLAARLQLDFIDKDDFVEALYDRSFPADRDERSILSRQADARFQSAVEVSSGAVTVSFWRRPELGHEFGTPFEWLRELTNAELSEVHCQCPGAVALDRFVTRVRHPGHHDIREATDEALESFSRTAALGPLDLGIVHIVDTSSPVTDELLDELARSIRGHR